MWAHIFFICLSILAMEGFSQSEEEKNWSINGYVKDLLSVNFSGDSSIYDNLIHNRINYKWFPNDELNIHIEIRNRFFWGETVKAIPNYGAFIDVNNDYLDLSVQTGEKSVLLHAMIDRAFFEWYKDDWEVRLGRQRINWGINLVWNPNDLFNAYSFFDFDFEERPGSDAIRIKHYTGVASSLEIASNVAEDFDQQVIAGMWKWNKWNYDFQFLAGKAQEDIALGFGWAGNLKNAGFKGEITHFNSYNDETKSLLASVAVDYSFESSLYFNGSVLFNSGASDGTENVNLFSPERLTAKTISPFRYATFLQTSYSFHPLINGGLSTIYYPGEKDALFINPSVSISLKSNLDVNFLSQLYFEKQERYAARAKLLFLRVKWSF
ncbi:MAG: hypothetical protein RIM99_00745 [Cyclobacteriaceae bacterium]